MKTFSATPATIDKKWMLVDAEDIVLGRLATIVATRLRGKHKPRATRRTWTAATTSSSSTPRKYGSPGASGKTSSTITTPRYPGGLKTRTAARILGGKRPETVVIKAVQRMIPKGPLGRQQMANLKVYAGADHPHEAQQPEPLDIAAMNPKNARSTLRG